MTLKEKKLKKKKKTGPDRWINHSWFQIHSVWTDFQKLFQSAPGAQTKAKRTVWCLRASDVASFGASREKSADRSCPQGDCPETRESPRLRALSTRLSCLCFSSSNSHKPAKLASSRSLFRLRSSFMGSESAGSRNSEQPPGSFVAIILSSLQPTKPRGDDGPTLVAKICCGFSCWPRSRSHSPPLACRPLCALTWTTVGGAVSRRTQLSLCCLLKLRPVLPLVSVIVQVPEFKRYNTLTSLHQQ